MTAETTRKYSSPNSAYQSVESIAERYEVAPATIRGWVRRGKFPAPVKITARCARWRLADVERWEAKQMAGGVNHAE